MKDDARKTLWARVSNRLYTSVMEPLKEREFVSGQGQSLRYMFFPYKGSDTLVVGFSACNDSGAKYNYVKSVQECKVNRLFLKDDFGPDHYGDYYLGCHGTYSVEKAVYELMNVYLEKLHPKTLIFMGSSKGGYAALNFGLHYPGAQIIIAAPQYYLASYLDSDKWRFILEDILGSEVTDENKNVLDMRLKAAIAEDKFAASQTVYIQYSDQEHTYEEHIKDLLKDLRDSQIAVYEDVKKYSMHSDLKYYFPAYLRNTINGLCRKGHHGMPGAA